MYLCVLGVRKFVRLHYLYIVLVLNPLNTFSNVCCNCSIKKLLYNTRSLLKEIILYRKMFYSFLVNNFHELLRNNNNSINKNNKFVFEIYTLGQNFVKIINLYLPFFSRKIAWSYSATDTLSTKSPTRAIPKTNADNAPIQYPRYHIIIL